MKNVIFRMVAIAAIFAFSASGRADDFYPQSTVVRQWAQDYTVPLVVGVDYGSGELFFTDIYGEGQVKVEGITGYTFIVENFHFADAVNEFETIQNNIMGTVSAWEESTAYKATFWADSYSKNNQAMSLAMTTAFMKLATYPVTLANTEEMRKIRSDIEGIGRAMQDTGNKDEVKKIVDDLTEKLRDSIKEAQDKAKKAADDVGLLKGDIDGLKGRIKSAESGMKALEELVDKKTIEKSTLSGMIKDSVDAAVQVYSSEVAALGEQVELYQSQKESYESQKSEIEGKISGNSSRIEKIEGQISALNEMKQGASADDIEMIEGLIEIYRDELQRVSEDNTALNRSISSINSAISKINSNITSSNSRITTLNGKLEELETKQNEIQGDISAAEEEIENANSRITELSDEVSDLRDEMNEKLEYLKTEMQTLKGALAKAAVTKVTQEIVNKTENFFPVAGVSIGDLCYTNAMIELSKYMGNSNPTNGGVAFDAPTRGEGGAKFTSIDEYLNWKGVTVAVTNQNSEYGMAFVLGSNRYDSVTAPFGAPENWVAEGGGIVVTNGQYRVMFGGAWSYADGGFMGCTVQMGSIGWHQSFMPYSAIGDVYAVITYSDVDNPSVTLSATPVNVRGETISIWVGTLVSDGSGGVRARSTRNSPITIIMYE